MHGSLLSWWGVLVSVVVIAIIVVTAFFAVRLIVRFVQRRRGRRAGDL